MYGTVGIESEEIRWLMKNVLNVKDTFLVLVMVLRIGKEKKLP